MKKIFLLILGLIISLSKVFADPVVELAAPRIKAPIIQADDMTIPHVKSIYDKPEKVTKKTPSKTAAKGKHKVANAHKKYIHKKPVIVKVDYEKISKMIEYGYYDYADNTLAAAIKRKPSDIRTLALSIVSQAKQAQLDTAQAKLDSLLKKYPNNSDLHYAQGIVDYQRTASSNMYYRNNSDKLINDSMAEFQKAIKLDKNNARAYNAAGVIALRQGSTNDAKNYFKLAIAKDNTYSMAIDNSGTLDFADGKTKIAEAKFAGALKYNPQNPTAMYHLAQVAVQNRDYNKALKYLNKAAALNPTSPAIFNLQGKIYEIQGNEAAAINALKQSISIKPEFSASYLDLADIYDNRGDSDFAIEQLKTAINVNPANYDARIKLADISLGTGKFKQAIKAYGELVGVDSYNDAALKGLANAYYGQAQIATKKAYLGSSKDLQNAIKYINKAIEANPQDLELHLAKLKLTKLADQHDETLLELNKITQSTANDLISNVVKGEAYLTLSDYDNAQKYFNIAIGLSKGTDDDLYMADIFTYQKQLNCAETVLNRVLQLDQNNQQAINNLNHINKCKKIADNYYNAAVKFISERNNPAAVDYLNRSLEINPINAQAHLKLAQLLEKQKDYEGALVNYKAYLSLNPYGYDSKSIQKKIKQLDDKL